MGSMADRVCQRPGKSETDRGELRQRYGLQQQGADRPDPGMLHLFDPEGMFGPIPITQAIIPTNCPGILMRARTPLTIIY